MQGHRHRFLQKDLRSTGNKSKTRKKRGIETRSLCATKKTLSTQATEKVRENTTLLGIYPEEMKKLSVPPRLQHSNLQ